MIARGCGRVCFAVHGARYKRDCGARHNFAEEDHAPSGRAVRHGSADVEAEVDLLEAGVEGGRHAQDSHAIEEKADQ